MEKIKFRGYDKDNKCWRYGHYYEGILTDTPVCLADARICCVIIDRGIFYHVDKESVGQYTGMKSINNGEVYEGDIKEWRFNTHIWTYLCYWSSTDCGFRWRRIKHNEKFENYLEQYDTKASFNLAMKTSSQRSQGIDRWSRIIGNAYENSELLYEREE